MSMDGNEPIEGKLEAGSSNEEKPACILLIGMAGSGKSTLAQRLNGYLRSKRKKSPSTSKKREYAINLDPAVLEVAYNANVDIRDTINYSKVMEHYQLGPNGAILTSLNLFTAKFDQVLNLLEKRASTISHVVIDTPGQIEVFQWSASGQIITDALASTFPTMILFCVDTTRAISPITFMSSMLYACSVLYKSRLPIIVVLTKTDAQSETEITEWIRDFEAFQAALKKADEEAGPDGLGYISSLVNSMSLVLDEFYEHLDFIGVSAVSGRNIPELFELVEKKKNEYYEVYKPELERIKALREEELKANKQQQLEKLMKDLSVKPNSKSDNISNEEDSDSNLEEESSQFEGFIEPDGDENERVTHSNEWTPGHDSDD